MIKCRVCDSQTTEVVSFGKMPIANAFIYPNEFDNEYYFNLDVVFCSTCGMVQLENQPDREKMFHDNYAFFSSTSKKMAEHFEKFSCFVQDKYLKSSDSFVVEMGSNDGIMLKNFSKKGIKNLGIEPSSNVAEVARKQGIETICEFFDDKLAERIVKTHGQADAFMSANVMCHIPYLHSVAEGIRILLKPTGVLIFEDPYLGDIIEKTSYDQIYDEHVFYFSVRSVQELFGRHGLEVVDVHHQKTHGGSMRYVLAHKGAMKISQAVYDQLKKEEELGLNSISKYEEFKNNVQKSRNDLLSLLIKLKEDGKRVVGYAATSKSTTVINYCNITPDLVEFISDTTPIKQGKLTPGGHIPVLHHDKFKENYPDYALLFGWNHAEEIIEKEKDFINNGGKWILYVPSVKIM